jgi:hypothetical protein
VLVLAGLTVGGCAATTQTSTGSFQGDAHLVAQAINDLSSAASSHDNAKICNQLLAPALVTVLNRSTGGCQRAVGNQLDDTDNFDLTVQSCPNNSAPNECGIAPQSLSNGAANAANGTTATAWAKDIQSGHTHYDKLKLVKQSGSWRVSGLG